MRRIFLICCSVFLFAVTARTSRAGLTFEAGPVPVSPIVPTWETQTEARVFSQIIPAPRGRIVDRQGRPLAQSKLGHYLQVQLPLTRGLSKEEVLRFAHAELTAATGKLEVDWKMPDDALIHRHYLNRRWIPLVFSPLLSDAVAGQVVDRKVENEAITLLPVYLRHYPEKSLACHIVGHIGRQTRLHDTSPLANGLPLWPKTEGRDGLEATFDDALRGKPGQTCQVFSPGGEKLVDERTRDPEVGNDLVSTLDIDYQRTAEAALRAYTRSGAFVCMDVRTGDILAMASHPVFDPNLFVPEISEDEFAVLRDDPGHPLFGRAFRGLYPPASTFKPLVALAALERGIVDESDTYECTGRLEVDGRYFHNHNRHNEGHMNVVRALARSCNTWFYQAALEMGSAPLAGMAEQFGVGERTGIPVLAEPGGFMPNDERLRARFGHPLSGGYLANASIGQGHVLMTPLQVTQMMAGIGNGSVLPRPRLVRHIQSPDGRILQHFPVESRRALDIDPAHIRVVTNGLYQVVHGSGGTGSRGAIGFAPVAAKTGTGQWGNPKRKQYVAWFAGFVPADDPVYAFAALYEGKPGSHVQGGRNAAPISAYFFREVFRKFHERYETEGGTPLPPHALAKTRETEESGAIRTFQVRDAIPVSAE